MEFINELKKNNICVSILNDIKDESWQDVQVTFSIHEVCALTKVAYYVYNAFCNDSIEDDGLPIEVSHFLDNLMSAYDKLNNYEQTNILEDIMF